MKDERIQIKGNKRHEDRQKIDIPKPYQQPRRFPPWAVIQKTAIPQDKPFQRLIGYTAYLLEYP